MKIDSNRIAYLIQGIVSCGKTTFGRQMAQEHNGVCLSIDDFWYKVHQADKPDEYTFDINRMTSMSRWYWISLKTLADAGASPIFIDQNNLFQGHTWKTAAFLMERYDYDVELVHPNTQVWTTVRKLLKDKEGNADELNKWATKLSARSHQNVPVSKVQQQIVAWTEYTIDDLIEQF